MDGFLACAAKTKQRLAAAHTRPCTPSLSSTSVVVSLGLREMLHYSDLKKSVDNTYVIRVRGFPIGRKFVSLHIESNSIRFIRMNCFNSEVSFVNTSKKHEQVLLLYILLFGVRYV